ncbi:UNVERIFIED_CONTAM: hypothetical protein GTU68_040940 [Idotea baltica]|nr:hypothetical protein [Idotea baltica]
MKIVKYGPSIGIPALRERVASYYNMFATDVAEGDVCVTTGASEAILFALLSGCDHGDEVIIPEPFYANYLGFADLSHVHIVPITTRIEDHFALPTMADFEEVITAKTKAIFLCNPGNPTGQMYTRADLDQLMVLVKKYNLFLIVDEVYREFCYDQPFTSVLSYPDMGQHVIVIDSISKVFSACGARVGYLVTKNQELVNVITKYANLRLCPPFYGQRLALACYDDSAKYIAAAKAEYVERREILYSGLSQIPDITYYKPTAAFYNMIELPVNDAEDFCKWLLTDFEYEGATVMLAPGSGFYFNKSLGRRQVRIAYVLNEQDLKAALKCLQLGLMKYRSREVSASIS